MKSILNIIPYEFYPTFGGGQLRCYHLLKAMSTQYEVTVLTVISSSEVASMLKKEFPHNVKFIEISKRTKYSNILSKLNMRIGDRLNYSFLNKSLFSKVNSFFLEAYIPLSSAISISKFDFIIYENLEVLSMFSSLINKFQFNAIKIYDAHNVDNELWLSKSKFENKKEYYDYSIASKKIESKLFEKVDFFISCSEIDKSKILRLNNNKIKGFSIPNGVDIAKNIFHECDLKFNNKTIIFCGTLDYFPNIEGIKWFYFEIYPIIKSQIPEIKLILVGKLVSHTTYSFLSNDKSVNIIGQVESVIPYYYDSAVAIIPLLSGSGTRLKVLEAMSLGNPIVATSIGAEGLDNVGSTNILIGNDPVSFANLVIQLFNDQYLFNSIRHRAKNCVNKYYNWSNIGSHLLGILKNLQEPKYQ